MNARRAAEAQPPRLANGLTIFVQVGEVGDGGSESDRQPSGGGSSEHDLRRGDRHG
jgi:hypothetical protein